MVNFFIYKDLEKLNIISFLFYHLYEKLIKSTLHVKLGLFK